LRSVWFPMFYVINIGKTYAFAIFGVALAFCSIHK
jgi:hypothetical protein